MITSKATASSGVTSDYKTAAAMVDLADRIKRYTAAYKTSGAAAMAEFDFNQCSADIAQVFRIIENPNDPAASALTILGVINKVQVEQQVYWTIGKELSALKKFYEICLPLISGTAVFLKLPLDHSAISTLQDLRYLVNETANTFKYLLIESVDEKMDAKTQDAIVNEWVAIVNDTINKAPKFLAADLKSVKLQEIMQAVKKRAPKFSIISSQELTVLPMLKNILKKFQQKRFDIVLGAVAEPTQLIEHMVIAREIPQGLTTEEEQQLVLLANIHMLYMRKNTLDLHFVANLTKQNVTAYLEGLNWFLNKAPRRFNLLALNHFNVLQDEKNRPEIIKQLVPILKRTNSLEISNCEINLDLYRFLNEVRTAMAGVVVPLLTFRNVRLTDVAALKAIVLLFCDAKTTHVTFDGEQLCIGEAQPLAMLPFFRKGFLWDQPLGSAVMAVVEQPLSLVPIKRPLAVAGQAMQLDLTKHRIGGVSPVEEKTQELIFIKLDQKMWLQIITFLTQEDFFILHVKRAPNFQELVEAFRNKISECIQAEINSVGIQAVSGIDVKDHKQAAVVDIQAIHQAISAALDAIAHATTLEALQTIIIQLQLCGLAQNGDFKKQLSAIQVDLVRCVRSVLRSDVVLVIDSVDCKTDLNSPLGQFWLSNERLLAETYRAIAKDGKLYDFDSETTQIKMQANLQRKMQKITAAVALKATTQQFRDSKVDLAQAASQMKDQYKAELGRAMEVPAIAQFVDSLHDPYAITQHLSDIVNGQFCSQAATSKSAAADGTARASVEIATSGSMPPSVDHKTAMSSAATLAAIELDDLKQSDKQAAGILISGATKPIVSAGSAPPTAAASAAASTAASYETAAAQPVKK